MLVRLFAGDPHSGSVGIGDRAEHMRLARVHVGLGKNLQGNGTGRDDEVVGATANITRHGVGRRVVALGVVDADVRLIGSDTPAFSQAIENTGNMGIQ